MLGRDDGWFLVPSLVAATGLFVGRRRRPRTDPLRAAAILWTAWLVLTGIFFSSGRYLNSYYLAALTPAMAALCGMGAALVWRCRHHVTTRLVVLGTVIGGVAYSLALVPADAGIRTVVLICTAVAGVPALGVLVWSLRRRADAASVTVGLGLSVVALFVGATLASGSVLARGQGPFDTPYEPNAVTFINQTRPNQLKADWPAIVRFADTFRPDQAADVFETSFDAGYDIMITGHEFLPVGGYTGRVPATTVSRFRSYVSEGRVTRTVVAVVPLSRNPVMRWITRHCVRETTHSARFSNDGAIFQRYYCTPGPDSG